jgi:hypothetical protein
MEGIEIGKMIRGRKGNKGRERRKKAGRREEEGGWRKVRQ